MKLALVCPYDWSHPGGVRTHIIGLAGALRRMGVETEIVAPASRRADEIFAVGSTVGIPSNGSVARICFSASAKRKIAARLAEGDIDLVHLHEPVIPSVSLLVLMGTGGRPAVATFHAAAGRSLAYAVARPLLQRYLDRVAGRIAVSRAARDFISHYFPGDYRLVPNGVDTPRFSGAAPDQEAQRYKPFVLFLGRPERRKGFDVAVEAVRRLRERLDVRLVTVGATPRVAENWMVPLGAIDDERVPGVYAAADVFCAPSLGGESFGVVLAEAMAAGAPVVGSDLPGYREAAGDAALLVPPGDVVALTEAVEKVLGDPAVSNDLRQRGRARARDLDWNVLAGRIVSIYEEALGVANGGDGQV